MLTNIENLGEYTQILTWGLEKKDLLELLKEHPACNVKYYEYTTPYLAVNCVAVYNFMGDCGSLYLSGANYADRAGLAFIKDFASHSGFSNIFATVCKTDATNTMAIFKEMGWEEIYTSASNRNPEKEHHVLFLYIDCVKKGY